MTIKITLTVPYAGKDRVITGTPVAIAKAAELVARGLPTIEQLDLTPAVAELGEEGPGTTTMGMSNGGGRDHVQGSHLLIMALRDAMFAREERIAA